MDVGELSGVVGLVVAIGSMAATWGALRAQHAAHEREIESLKKSTAGQGRRLGGLQTAVAVLAARAELAGELSRYLDGAGAGRRPTSPVGLALGADESGEHEGE